MVWNIKSRQLKNGANFHQHCSNWRPKNKSIKTFRKNKVVRTVPAKIKHEWAQVHVKRVKTRKKKGFHVILITECYNKKWIMQIRTKG